MGAVTYGFVPSERLHKLNAASPKEDFSFLLKRKKIKDQLKGSGFGDAKTHLNERILLLSQAAIVTGNHDYIKAAQTLCRKYKQYSLDHDNIDKAEAILKRQKFHKNWLINAQRIACVWRKSFSFSSTLKQQFPDEHFDILDDPDLFLTETILLNSSQVYHIQEIAYDLFSEWKEVLKYDYGLIENHQVTHLGALTNHSSNYEIFLDCSTLLASVNLTHDQQLHHISRRIIALAASAIINAQRKYYAQAEHLAQATREKGMHNGELDLALEYLTKAKALDLDTHWKEKWLNLKLILENEPEARKRVKGNYHLSLLKDNDLATTIQKYLFVVENENIPLELTSKSGIRKVSPRKVAYLTPHETEERDIDELDGWLKSHYPIVFDLFRCQEADCSLKNFLEKHNKPILRAFHKDIIDTTQNGSEEFSLYQEAKTNSEVSYFCFEHFLKHDRKVVAEFLANKHFYNFISFLFHKHSKECSDFLEKYMNNKELNDNGHTFKTVQSHSNVLRRKSFLVQLHQKDEFLDFFKSILFEFYGITSNQPIIDICFLLQNDAKNSRNEILEILDIFYAIHTMSIFECIGNDAKLLIGCYDYFLGNNFSAVEKYLANESAIFFLKFVNDHYPNDLKQFLIQRHLDALERLLPSLGKMRKHSPKKKQQLKLNKFSEVALILAKQYTHLFITNKHLQSKYQKKHESELKQILVSPSEVASIKESGATYVDINKEIFEIKKLKEEYSIEHCWTIVLTFHGAYKEKGYRYDLIPIPSVETAFRKSDEFLTVSKIIGDLIKSRMVEIKKVFLKIGSNVFKVCSLEEAKLGFSYPVLTIAPTRKHEKGAAIFTMLDPTYKSNPSSVPDVIMSLQGKSFIVRRRVAKMLDELRKDDPGMFD